MDLKIFKETLGKIPITEEYFLFVVHLTGTEEPYLSEWVKSCKNIGIISIPYSENKEVKERLARLTNVYEVSDYQKIPSLIKTLCKKHNDKKIILIEIGGYSSDVSKYLKNVILSVEDTNQGYWRFKERECNLSYPVISIAKTDLKSLENRLDGRGLSGWF